MKAPKVTVLTDISRLQPEAVVNRQAFVCQKQQGEQWRYASRCLVDWSKV